MKTLKRINRDSVKVRVDGALMPGEPLVCPMPFDIDFEPGSLIAENEPPDSGDSTTISSCGWIYVLGPLSAGSHTVLISTKFGDLKFQIHLSITVA
jgi:hypothetical protein